jgi:hypothetical protein
MYTTSKQTTIKYLFVSCSSPASQSSISCVLVLNYEFPLNIFAPICFSYTRLSCPVSVPDYSRPVLFKMRGHKQKRGFSVRFCLFFIPNHKAGWRQSTEVRSFEIRFCWWHAISCSPPMALSAMLWPRHIIK